MTTTVVNIRNLDVGTGLGKAFPSRLPPGHVYIGRAKEGT